jgi:hypothetical protein
MGIKKGNSLGVPFFGFKRKRRDKNTFASSAMSHFQYITARWRVRLCRLLDILCIHMLFVCVRLLRYAFFEDLASTGEM